MPGTRLQHCGRQACSAPSSRLRASFCHARPSRRQHAAPVAAQQPEAAAAAAAAGPEQQQQQQQRPAVPVTFILGGADITVEAQPGQNLWEVANDAGAHITLGCSQGSCGICEIEVWKYGGSSSSTVPSTGIVRACIAGVPSGYTRLEVREVPDDAIWGVDGFDT